jgi:hypothetical protein
VRRWPRSTCSTVHGAPSSPPCRRWPDAINGGDASFNDWWDQFNDPSFGFGNVVGSTGNIWADRFIGFAGDVLLDPLTYVGGSSAISGTGRTMRIGSATRALAKTGEEELAQRLGIFGWSSINREQRAMLREVADETILDPGYYAKLPFAERLGIAPATQGRWRIPGTGALEQGIARTFGGARAAFNQTRTGELFRYISSRGGLEDAITKVVTGKGPMDFTVAAETIRYQNAAKRAGPAAVARLNALGRQMLDEHGREAMQAGSVRRRRQAPASSLTGRRRRSRSWRTTGWSRRVDPAPTTHPSSTPNPARSGSTGPMAWPSRCAPTSSRTSTSMRFPFT